MILRTKYNDDIEEHDLTNPEVLETITNLVQKGMYFDRKGKNDLDEAKATADKYKGYIDNYNTTIQSAKSDPEVLKQFVSNLERELGRSLTPAEAQDADESLFDQSDPKIAALESQIAELKQGLQNQQVDRVGRDIQNVHTNLSRDFDGSNGMPKYDSIAVQSFIDDKKLYSEDLQGLYRDTYHTINRDKIYEQFKSKNFQDKRNNVHIQNGNNANLNLQQPINTAGKSYNEVKSQILESNAKSGSSFTQE